MVEKKKALFQIQTSHILSFKRTLKEQGKGEITIECYSRDVSHFLKWLLKHHKRNWIQSSEDLRFYLEALGSEYHLSINSRRRKLISLKVFCTYLTSVHYTSMSSPAQTLPIPPRDESLPDLLSCEDIDHILNISQSSSQWYKALRDPALISLLAFEGLKSYEILALRRPQLYEHNSKNTSEPSFSLTIPGGRHRTLMLSSTTSLYLRNYLQGLEQALNSQVRFIAPTAPHKEGPLFFGLQGRSGWISEKPMSRHGMKLMLYNLGKEAGLQKLGTEQLRHYALDYLLEEGKTPHELKTHLGLRREGNITKHIQRRRRAAL